MIIFSGLFNEKRATNLKCNGLHDLCDLQIDQITFPGSHNAGSGFDGHLHYSSGILAVSCFYRNHGKSFSGQLEFGIRYFDVDTSYGKTEALNCHCSGKTCAYTGSIKKGLLQVDTWMKSHPNEVIVIHFNRDVQSGYHAKIAKSLENSLLSIWPASTSGKLGMNSVYKAHWKWPTLGDAISSNKRIFIFMDKTLTILKPYDWLVQSNGRIASTWATNAVSSSCSGITTNAKNKCDKYTDFIDLSAFGSYGLCTWHMAKVCSKWLGQAANQCYKLREVYGRTVNFLLVDWSDYHKGKESVVNKAKFMNQKNIKKHLGKSIFFPELTGCSYHAGWFKNYCWKYCSEYGWCWINKYCGRDAGVRKKADYPCYSRCGY